MPGKVRGMIEAGRSATPSLPEWGGTDRGAVRVAKFGEVRSGEGLALQRR